MILPKYPIRLIASLFTTGLCAGAVTQATGALIQTTGAVTPALVKDDPLFKYQWHLKNYGKKVIADTVPIAGVDVNLGSLHTQNIRGKGVILGVVDDGLEIRHEDLMGNVIIGGSKNFVDGSNDPTPVNGSDEHGTSVAGIAGAVGWNGKGGRGVAPQVRLKGFNFLSSDADGLETSQDMNIRYSWGVGQEARDVTVFNNSWGGAGTSYDAISLAELASWEKLMRSTRGGKGGIYVKSAGNGFLRYTKQGPLGPYNACLQKTKDLKVSCTLASVDSMNNFIGTITVAAVNAKGLRSSYSTAGASIWISGIGGEYGYQKAYAPDYSGTAYDPAVVTTDLSGCARGANKDDSKDNELSTSKSKIDASCNYWARMNGTSAAAPTVSGVASLLLGAYPTLSSRDVKYILATTAKQIDILQPKATYEGAILDPGWLTNSAGHHFSNWYGFGLVDATAALKKAETFKPLPKQQDTGWLASTNSETPIGGVGDRSVDDEPIGAMTVSISRRFKVEAVQVSFSTTHKTPANLRGILTSPDGTKSYLLVPFSTLDPIGAEGTGFTVPLSASNAFLDESSSGNWKLQLTDVVDPKTTAKLKSFKIRVVGY